MSDIQKTISFKIKQQFPALYREHGAELVALVEDYYKWTETADNQSIYNSRRMFEYRDIATTLDSMIIFFHKKFMADLPLQEKTTTKFIVRNILDLYRRKGSESGIQIFFRLFFQEDVEVNYPSKYMFKPSNSSWKNGVYLQLSPNNGRFFSNDGLKEYSYKDLLSKNIVGSISGARAAVDKINFFLLNDTVTPVIFIDEVKGQFIKFDDIIARIDGYDIRFGVVSGSASELEIDLQYGGSVGNNKGDILNIESKYGKGALAIVTETRQEATGVVDYTLLDGGFGYTVENTTLYVSNQVIIKQNTDFDFTPLERLRDSAGNEGIVIGQNSNAIGVLMNDGDEFAINRPISTLDRNPNITLPLFNRQTQRDGVISITPKNTTSPGPQYSATLDPNDAKVSTLSDIESVSLMTDVIQGYLGVSLNAADYNAAPATQPMSGTADPVTINTPLDEAFDLTPFNIGTIDSFENINPGSGYENDVWCLVRDDVMTAFERYEQILILDNFSATLSVGDRITQNSTGVNGVITKLDSNVNAVYVTPFSYYGFKNAPILHKGNSYDVIATERDYNSPRFGENADMQTLTRFATGRISKVKVLNSGFGYVDGETVYLKNPNRDTSVPDGKATLYARSQGITSGYWGSFNSHINGYIANTIDQLITPILPTFDFAREALKVATSLTTTPVEFSNWLTTEASDGFAYGDMNLSGNISSEDAQIFSQLVVGTASPTYKTRWDEIVVPSLREQAWFENYFNLYTFVQSYTYYDSTNKIQDSDFYQEYSYQIKSIIAKNVYEDMLKENAHLAGTKMFGEFLYKKKAGKGIKSRFINIRKEDYIVGGDPVVGPNQPGFQFIVTVDRVDLKTDSVNLTVDISQ